MFDFWKKKKNTRSTDGNQKTETNGSDGISYSQPGAKRKDDQQNSQQVYSYSQPDEYRKDGIQREPPPHAQQKPSVDPLMVRKQSTGDPIGKLPDNVVCVDGRFRLKTGSITPGPRHKPTLSQPAVTRPAIDHYEDEGYSWTIKDRVLMIRGEGRIGACYPIMEHGHVDMWWPDEGYDSVVIEEGVTDIGERNAV